jgi:hypothetical protein
VTATPAAGPRDPSAAVGERRPIKVVAFGGGHGLGASLRGLLRCADEVALDITAIVTVGDDGGSSGRLRAERDALLPPGDLRQALAALATRSTSAPPNCCSTATPRCRGTARIRWPVTRSATCCCSG